MKEDVIVSLRAGGSHLLAVETANLLDELTQGDLSHWTVIMYFKHAFPSIPLRLLMEAGGWHRLGGSRLDDNGFNDLLRPWLPGS